MDEVELGKIAEESVSYSEFARKTGHSFINGTVIRKVKQVISDNSLDVTHFDRNSRIKQRKYAWVDKICPVCNNTFEVKEGHPKEKTVCSHSCSNTYFRSGSDHPNWEEDRYRSTCFEHHKKECVICGEDRIVAVHHFDEDRTNNNPENLIPMCPTHHQYMHSRYKELISGKVEEYIETLTF